ncbi:hypothetical protein YM18_2109 [Geobacter sulfurreducens]|nr:hypothetical protein YM18_2109 [Geobacter sulfurreducens]
MPNCVKNTSQVVTLSQERYQVLSQFCDNAISQAFSPELSQLVDAAIVLMQHFETGRCA